ncbi:MAG: anti-phage-associated DUF1156 domain-containing protein [Meiothermus sp.]|nr:anti-phage-associated DUF1156 domain-containing protein [Meiothermus sp.]
MTESKPSEVTQDLANAKSFIEVQLPVAKLSAESYKERKAVFMQTLTGLGKWWGRKPLVMVRATILGLLLPATDNPTKDREVFLKLMTMDEDGLEQRRSKNLALSDLLKHLTHLPEAQLYLDPNSDFPKLKSNLSREDKSYLQLLAYRHLPYSEKLDYADRPEQIGGPTEQAWVDINAHLGTNANSLVELVEELGIRRFGHRPIVGDSFCGGGSIPFEAARIGCQAYASDLNPVAGLLTWAALNIVGGGSEVAEKIQRAQHSVFEAVDRQFTEWGIEHNEQGWRADAFLYCVEVIDPESGWRVPLAPSWVIAEKPRVIAKLIPDPVNRRFDFEIIENPSEQEFHAAKRGTVKDSRLVFPLGGASTPIQVIRRNLRLWENNDVVPRAGDVFQERLYCIRWVETYRDAQGKEQTRRHYCPPGNADLDREQKAVELLLKYFEDWQTKGYIPSHQIEPGDETTRLQRERGWTHWHHLFNPRQLLQIGLFLLSSKDLPLTERAAILLLSGRLADWNSRLSVWLPSNSSGIGGGKNTFLNQAFNTNYNYSTRSFLTIQSVAIPERKETTIPSNVVVKDGRLIDQICDVWITDPPYADAVNYPELSEFYLSWYEGQLRQLFPDWYVDSKRALAVRGNDSGFRSGMVDCYKRLAEKMPENGLQVVMFTHQDAGVWADLAMILWAAGLRVTAAWTVATETGPATGEGNYVQGTVLLVLRKRTATDSLFKHQLVPYIEFEVRRQLDEMTALEDASDPNFTDSDYQLAAYAAALRILTAQPIDDIDPEKELLRARAKGEENPLKGLIEQAVRIAADHQVPKGFDKDTWKRLLPLERFYLKGLELEAHGERRSGAYQELARGFGVANYDDLFAESKANHVRLMTPTELARKYMQGSGFAGTLLRQVLFAVYAAAREDKPRAGLDYLKTELADTYWSQRERIMHLLGYLAAQRHNGKMSEWKKDGESADLLLGLIENDYA